MLLNTFPNRKQKRNRCQPCGSRASGQSRRGKKITKPKTAKWRESMSSLSVRQKRRVARLGKRLESPKLRRGSPDHVRARWFMVRSPARQIYQVANVTEFVRTHLSLFLPNDVINLVTRPAAFVCRATNGLCSLVRKKGRAAGSWKGWTLVSVQK